MSRYGVERDSNLESLEKLYLKGAHKDWKFFTETRYREYKRQNPGPPSLKFFATENIKKLQFTVAHVEEGAKISHFHKYRFGYEKYNGGPDKTPEIANKSHEEVWEEALAFVKESPKLSYWLN